MKTVLLVLLAFCGLVVPTAHAGPGMSVGAAEDTAKWGGPAVAGAKMDVAQLGGFDTIRLTTQWTGGAAVPDAELTALRNAVDAANFRGIRIFIAIFPASSAYTPLTDTARADFASYAAGIVRAFPTVNDFIVGNEPNNNYYWQPQFNADGSDAAAQGYLQLLAQTYDAIKGVRPGAIVIGGALSPRGGDVASSAKPTHSPTAFIRDLGAAYRASGRTTPLMDEFDLHPYGDSSATPPSFDHPNVTTISVADYPKLVALLGEAFDGTAQAGSSLPIVYGEFGIQSTIPAAKAAAYTGTEPSVTVNEQTQGAYYREALKLAYCQPNVRAFLVFHVSDEANLGAWQSGTYYADDTAKTSMATVRDSASQSRAGTLTACPDATPPTAALTAPANGALLGATVNLAATASDDVGVGRVEFLANGAVVGYDAQPPYALTWKPAASGIYTIAARALDGVRNAGLSSSVTITVDRTPPETTITSAPAASTTDTGATFAFTASEPSTYECALDAAPYTSCTSPAMYGGLAPGSHTFKVRAMDALGNTDPTPAAYSWTVDLTPPETSISSGPAAYGNQSAVSFAFTSSEPGSTFQCALDGAAWVGCSSPQAYSGLADGSHGFQVRAIDPAGNSDPTPAGRSFTIDTSGGLLVNGSFEGSSLGWTTWNSQTSITNDGILGSHAVRLTLTTSDRYALISSPKPVEAAQAAPYQLNGWLRSDSPGKSVCLRLREWQAGTVIKSPQNCLTATGSWQRFPTVTLTPSAGDQLDVNLIQYGATPGDSFESDGLSLTQG
jgi:hypothetical protein